jgi:hypothetical protein
MPTDRARLGDAFVEAWLALRGDLDTMSHGGVHPRLLGSWLAAAPRFLLRDVVRLATEPQVALAAATRLAAIADDRDRDLLTDLAQVHHGRPLAHAYRAIGIRAGDRRAVDQALDGLADPRGIVRLESARALAAAGDRRGLKQLRRMVATPSELSDLAARAIGAYGTRADEALLAKLIARNEQRAAARAALGELLLRRLFKDYHLAIVRRDPAGQRMTTNGGLYDTWLDAARQAVGQNVKRPEALVDFVEQLRREQRSAGGGEVVRRRLSAFAEFLAEAGHKLRATGPRPSWPGSFDEALERIRERPRGADATAEAFAARVAAEIAICAWTARRIDHKRLGPITAGLRFITPGGARADDGSFSTSWRFADRARLVVELSGSRPVTELWLANTCGADRGPSIERVSIVGTSGDNSWSLDAELAADTRYFQRVEIGKPGAERLEITFHVNDKDRPACLAEMRIL